jgi:UDP-N-acetylmuramyl tripeptide synthase
MKVKKLGTFCALNQIPWGNQTKFIKPQETVTVLGTTGTNGIPTQTTFLLRTSADNFVVYRDFVAHKRENPFWC